jgi:arylsulfatase A-like enzyme
MGEEERWQTAKARYWGNCSLVDTYAGRILRRLEELGLAEETVVVYTSDHGDMMGEHHLLQKGLPFEASARVPLLIHVPGMSSRRVATPVSLVQLVPTLLDLVGRPLPSHLQGTSLRPLLEDGDEAPDQTEVVVEWNGPFRVQHLDELRARGYLQGVGPGDLRLTAVQSRTIRCGRWKLTVHASGEHELYDLQSDPAELHNAFWDPGVADEIAALTARLRRWQRGTNDAMILPVLTR